LNAKTILRARRWASRRPNLRKNLFEFRASQGETWLKYWGKQDCLMGRREIFKKFREAQKDSPGKGGITLSQFFLEVILSG
jgi:hypothetical protein